MEKVDLMPAYIKKEVVDKCNMILKKRNDQKTLKYVLNIDTFTEIDAYTA